MQGLHFYTWLSRDCRRIVRLLIKNPRRLYDPEGESDYEMEEKERENGKDENVTTITNA